MLMVTREALKTALREAFPKSAVPQLHESNLPVGFKRPALMIQMMPWGPRHVASSIHEFKVRWQVVYFPREDAAGNAVQADLFDAVSALEMRFGRENSLTAPDGTVLRMEDFNAEEREDVVYASLALCGYLEREEPAVTLLGEAEINMSTEEST